jgi:hypothetical protein
MSRMAAISVKIALFCAMVAAAVLLAAVPGRPALALAIDLGAASNFAVLEMGSGNVSLSSGSIVGNVGIDGGNFSDSNTPISGSLTLGPGATSSLTSPSLVTGGINTNVNLSSVVTAANNASAAAAALTVTSSLTSIVLNSGQSLTLAPGVYDLSQLTLNNATLTLSGNGNYTFNIGSGGMSVNGSQILGTSANDLFNDTGTQAVSITGGGNASVVDGTILAPHAQVTLAPGVVTPEIISGNNISIASGAQVHGAPGPIIGAGLPAFALLVLGGGFLLAWRLRRRAERGQLSMPAGL